MVSINVASIPVWLTQNYVPNLIVCSIYTLPLIALCTTIRHLFYYGLKSIFWSIFIIIYIFILYLMPIMTMVAYEK